MDPVTGKPKVHHHLDVVPEGTAIRVDVHGSTGHMGSILENDGAITKMAHLVRWFVRSKAKLRDLAKSEVSIELVKAEDVDLLTLEGGQGFVPTHDITEVMKRMADAAVRGADAYLRLIGSNARAADAVHVTYDKLHNAAFDGDPDSVPMRNAVAAAKACGMWKDQPVSGWTVSCDSRIFATEYPGMPVLTCGAGRLAHAHADQEQLKITEMRSTVEFLALYMLLQAGTV